MSGDMSREDLLAMLSGGAKKKKRNPWLSFLKKHPNLSMAEASKKYHSKKGKGVGFEDDMEGGATEGEDEFYIEGGKIKRRRRKKATRKRRGRGVDEETVGFGYSGGADYPISSWQTAVYKDREALKKLGVVVYKFLRSNFKKDFKDAKKAVGAGATNADFQLYAKESKLTGNKLREEWDKLLVANNYESFKEIELLWLGSEVKKLMKEPQFARLLYIVETGEEDGPRAVPRAAPTAPTASSSSSGL